MKQRTQIGQRHCPLEGFPIHAHLLSSSDRRSTQLNPRTRDYCPALGPTSRGHRQMSVIRHPLSHICVAINET